MHEQRVELEAIDDARPPDGLPEVRIELDPVETAEEQADPGPGYAHRSSGRWVAAGASLAAVLLIVQTVLALAQLFERAPLLAVGWALTFVIVLTVAIRALWRFLRGLRRSRELEELQRQARFLIAHDGVAQGVAFCTRLAELSGDDRRPSFAHWRSLLSDTHNDREVLALYGRTVLAEADERALARVVTHAGDVTVMVALSRFPLLDMLFVLWRQLRLVEDVARAYGMDADYWARIRLLRTILRNMALAGASEVATEVGAQVLGAGTLARLSGAAAQGIGVGILTARLGLRAMAGCRTIPWDDDERPRLGHVSARMSANVRRYLGAAGGDDPDGRKR